MFFLWTLNVTLNVGRWTLDVGRWTLDIRSSPPLPVRRERAGVRVSTKSIQYLANHVPIDRFPTRRRPPRHPLRIYPRRRALCRPSNLHRPPNTNRRPPPPLPHLRPLLPLRRIRPPPLRHHSRTRHLPSRSSEAQSP